MGVEGVSAEAQASLTPLDPIAREQALDFIRLRRFRQSLLVRESAVSGSATGPQGVGAMHVSAAWELTRAAAAGDVHKVARRLDPAGGGGGPVRKLLDEIAARQPAALAVAAIGARFSAGPTSGPLESILMDACTMGIVDLHVLPPALAAEPSDRPLASPLARLQAGTGDSLTSLLHIAVSIADTNALRLLPLVDGTRDRAALAGAVRQLGLPIDASRAAEFVDYALQKFARLGLLMADPGSDGA